NLTNIIVFLRLGLKDSINICFLVLSCTDLVSVLLLTLGDWCKMLPGFFREQWRIDGQSLSWFLAFYYGPFYDVSQGITTFIAVQKSWCVALPFRFKDTFTSTRTSAILTVMCLAIFSIHIPVFASQDLIETLDPGTNGTLVKLWTSAIREKVFSAVGLVSLVFTTTCQMTVIFCLFVLASTLRASSKFRSSSTTPNLDPPIPDLKNHRTKFKDRFYKNAKTQKMSSKKLETDFPDKVLAKRLCEMNTSERRGVDFAVAPPLRNTSRKEVQAIKSTTFVSILFVSCNTLKLLNYYVLVCVPDYSIFGRYQSAYVMTNDIRMTLEALNISCNIFIYLKFNSRFRAKLSSGLG
ncbi:unnamed protein product, partial [Lymnaea stagnalis]